MKKLTVPLPLFHRVVLAGRNIRHGPNKLIAGALLLALLPTTEIYGADPESRTWIDATGKFSVEAILVEVSDGKVVLRKKDDTIVKVPLDKLRAVDQAYARSRSESKKRPPATAWSIVKAEHDVTDVSTTLAGNVYKGRGVEVKAKDGEELIIVYCVLTANSPDKSAVDRMAAARSDGLFKFTDEDKKKHSRGKYAMFDSANMVLTTEGGVRVNPVWTIEPEGVMLVATTSGVLLSSGGESKGPWNEAAIVNGQLTALLAVNKRANAAFVFSVPKTIDYFKLELGDAPPVPVGQKSVRPKTKLK